jgi:hypothetical protein
MTLVKAKEIIDLNLKEAGKKMPPDVVIALTLASEDIDRTLYWRGAGHYDFCSVLLPSETE